MNYKVLFAVISVSTAAMVNAAAARIIRTEIQPGKQYTLIAPARFATDLNLLPVESGKVSFNRDTRDLRISVDFTDADVLSENTADQQMLQKAADAVQIFLKPENSTELWEVIVDGTGKKSVFFHRGAGAMFYPGPDVPAPVKITAAVSKNARGWQAEIVFPLEKTAKAGNIPQNAVWHIMVVRNNFGRNLDSREISTFPQSVGTVSDPKRFARISPVK